MASHDVMSVLYCLPRPYLLEQIASVNLETWAAIQMQRAALAAAEASRVALAAAEAEAGLLTLVHWFHWFHLLPFQPFNLIPLDSELEWLQHLSWEFHLSGYSTLEVGG